MGDAMSTIASPTRVVVPQRKRTTNLAAKLAASGAILAVALAFVLKYVFRYYLHYNHAAFNDPDL